MRIKTLKIASTQSQFQRTDICSYKHCDDTNSTYCEQNMRHHRCFVSCCVHAVPTMHIFPSIDAASFHHIFILVRRQNARARPFE